MAIPGSPLDARSQGCNQLIREGAVLVQSADDIAELLSGFDGAPRSSFREVGSEFDWDGLDYSELDDADSASVTALLSNAPIAVDELIRQSGQPPAAVQMALLELEIAGRLLRHAGCRVSLTH